MQVINLCHSLPHLVFYLSSATGGGLHERHVEERDENVGGEDVGVGDDGVTGGGVEERGGVHLDPEREEVGCKDEAGDLAEDKVDVALVRESMRNWVRMMPSRRSEKTHIWYTLRSSAYRTVLLTRMYSWPCIVCLAFWPGPSTTWPEAPSRAWPPLWPVARLRHDLMA